VILSDRRFRRQSDENRSSSIPFPSDEQYTTSALDLMLGDEILELKTVQELQSEEPSGVERIPVVDISKVDVKDLLQKYAKPRMSLFSSDIPIQFPAPISAALCLYNPHSQR
jgi:hypothetical protein